MMVIFFWLLLGVSIGSFINVLADRLPESQSLTTPPSHCSACGRRLTVRDLLPVISYLALRGRCRACGAAIGPRVFWVEVLTGAAFALIAIRIAPGEAWGWLQLSLFSLYLTALITVTITDLEHQLIFDAVILPASAVAVIGILIVDVSALPAHLLGGAIGAGLIALIIWLVPGGMGWGDAKLAGFIGLIVGLTGIPFALFVAFVSGGVVGGILLASGRKRRGQTIALGPFLAISGAFILFIGNDTAVRAFEALSRLMQG